ncbi:MAG: ferredoxin-thioredoxin reductase catalytic domain-containing protein [Candidatus Pacearchaeota archaeon]
MEKEAEKLKQKLQKYADSKNLKLNDDEKVTENIILALLRNKKFKGDIYCPCRVITGDKNKDKDIVCPCVFHRGEIELQGHCKCNLFFSK